MANYSVLGLYHEATSTADTIERLRELGVPDDAITVMSGVPYTPEMLGRSHVFERLGLYALIGAVGGLLAALFLTVVTPHLYPLEVGGQPLVPGPPTIIIVFEFTMLGVILATFAGMLAEIAFPAIGRKAYDRRITEGHIGVVALVDEAMVQQVEMTLRETGAHHLQQIETDKPPRERPLVRLAFVGVILLIPTIIGLLFAYSVLAIPLPTQMANQPSVGFQQGPRLVVPIAAIPVQGPVLISGQPATAPIPPTANSLQRGQVLYNINCVLCHGVSGAGDGPIGARFPIPPADLTSDRVQSQTDQQLYLVLTLGRGLMPTMAENLSRVQRWDVINHIRTLK